MNYKPAICCVGYNRPSSMKRLLDSVGKGIYYYDDITLIISIDECEKSDEVNAVADCFDWKYGKKRILRYKERLGGKEHALRCGDLSYEYGAVIYLEDDVVVAPGFYEYTIKALDFYGKNDCVLGIALYSQKMLFGWGIQFQPVFNGSDAFLFNGDVSWGQCWTLNGWDKFRSWNKHNNGNFDYCKNIPTGVYKWPDKTSWSKCIEYYMVKNGIYYVVPYYAYSTCMSDRGVHTVIGSDQCQVPLSMKRDGNFTFFPIESCEKYDAFFENEALDCIEGITARDICVDLNGLKYDWSGYKYLLTIKKLPYRIINSYGCSLEPVENNIIFGSKGNAIVLYEIPESYIPPHDLDSIPKYEQSSNRRSRLLDRFLLKQLISYTTKRILSRLFVMG